jgi:hypothetical protein
MLDGLFNMNYIAINSSEDIIKHHGVKGMKWGRRMAKRVKSWMDKENDKYYNSHKGLLLDYNYQKKHNPVEWNAVQRHTGAKTKSFTPPSKEILQRQKAEYEKLRAMKKEINDLNIERFGRFRPNDRGHVKKEHLAEYDKLDKITNKPRPHYDGPKLERWDKAYDRQVELTEIGMDYKYKKVKKAYKDYINK